MDMGGEKGSFSTSLGGAVVWGQALQTKRFRGFRFHSQLPIGLSLPLLFGRGLHNGHAF